MSSKPESAAREKNIRWTPEQEHFIVTTFDTLTATEQAKQLQVKYQNLVTKRMRLAKEGRVSFSDKAYLPKWTELEIEYLRDHYPTESMEAMQKYLRRTPVGIGLKAKRLGLVRKDGFFTVQSLADLLKVDSHKALDWVQSGILPAKQLPYRQGPYRVWHIAMADVERFLHEYPFLVHNWRQMAPHYFRSIVRQEWEKDPWYSLKEATRIVGLVNDLMLYKRIQEGECRGYQRSPGKAWSQWWIRKSWLKDFKRRDTREERRKRSTELAKHRKRRAPSQQFAS